MYSNVNRTSSIQQIEKIKQNKTLADPTLHLNTKPSKWALELLS